MTVFEVEPSAYYHEDTFPRLWNWEQVKGLVDSGDLGNLRRHPDFQAAYNEANRQLKSRYGSVVEYLIKIRLQYDNTSPITPTTPYFTADVDRSLIRIQFNDWPYSVPHGVQHMVVWSLLPLTHDLLTPDDATRSRIGRDGLWGFTGSLTSVKPENDSPTWREASREIVTFIENRWPPEEWETAWFMNPPRLQSVPGLAHFHVFAVRKLQQASADHDSG